MNKAIVKKFQKNFGGIFSKIEERILSSKGKYFPPIFIVGLPRCGSTLLYQLLIRHYDFCYFTNLTNFFYKSPYLISLLQDKFGKRYGEISESNFGLIKGLNSPSESGGIYRNWFDKLENNSEKNYIISYTIENISSINNRPFLSKNLYNSFRIDKLNDIFEKPLFIYLKRENLFIAQSLLFSRKKIFGDYNNWFGVKPKDYYEIKKIKDPFEQVVAQIRSIERILEYQINNLDGYYLDIDYEELCKCPRNELVRVMKKYNEITNIKIDSREVKYSNLKNNNIQTLSTEEFQKIQSLLKKRVI